MTGESGKPRATPSVCSQHCPPTEKHGEVRTRLNNAKMFSVKCWLSNINVLYINTAYCRSHATTLKHRIVIQRLKAKVTCYTNMGQQLSSCVVIRFKHNVSWDLTYGTYGNCHRRYLKLSEATVLA